MSSPSEKLGVNLSEAIATLEQLIEQFDLEKEALVTEKDEEIEAVKLELEAEKAKLRATRLAFEAKVGVSDDGCHMIVAIDLNIVWSETPEHWAWTTVPESRHAVAELLNVCWLEISCRLDMDKLSPNTKYASYLVYKFTDDSDGFSSSPGQAYAGIAGEENIIITNVYLVSEEDQWGSEKADQYPKERPDGWMEVELGEYFINEIETFGEIEMSFKETSDSWKNGLIVQGIEVRPK
ncbi:unnamed protein product [Rhodiola kirilowii]